MKQTLTAVAMFAACLLTACVTAPVAPKVDAALAVLKPLSPASLGEERVVNQRLHAWYGEREIVLDCVVQVTAERIDLIGLLPGGTRVFSVSYDGTQIQSHSSPLVPAAFRPEFLLADLQLAFWPLAALEKAAQMPWSLREPEARTRQLLRDGRLFAEVHRVENDPWNGRVWLVNFARGYSLSIDSRPLE